MQPSLEPEIYLERVDDGTFVATSAALPGYVARGDSESAALRRMRRALKLSVREQERDFLRLSPRADRDSVRWSRYRTPLSWALPLSRRVKVNLGVFVLGLAAGATVVGVARRR